MYINENLEMFNWYGWDSLNTCILEYSDWDGNGVNKNVGIVCFPLHFWKYFGFYRNGGYNSKRTFIGLGFFSIYWDS